MSRERRASPEAPGAAGRTRATFTVSAHPMCSRLSPSQNMWHCSLSCRRLHQHRTALTLEPARHLHCVRPPDVQQALPLPEHAALQLVVRRLRSTSQI